MLYWMGTPIGSYASNDTMSVNSEHITQRMMQHGELGHCTSASGLEFR